MSSQFISGGGSLPVFIKYDTDDKTLYSILSKVNGVFFTGGGLDLYLDCDNNVPHRYTQTALKIYKYAKKMNDQGIYFPVMGVCQGYELMHIMESEDCHALGYSNLVNENLNTKLTDYESRLF